MSRKIWFFCGIALLLALAAFRLAFPFWIENKVAQGMGDAGRISGAGVSLWRLAYQYQGLEFTSKDPAVKVPYFSCPEVDIALNWRALFRGRLMATVTLKKPLLNLFTPSGEEKPPEEEGPYWSESVKGLVPLTIDKIDIKDGELHFRDPGENPQIDMHLEGIEIHAENFSGQNFGNEEFPGSISARAGAMTDGSVTLEGRFNPSAASAEFEYKVELRGLKLRALNPLLLRFAGVDVQGGSLDLEYEASAQVGKYKGLVETTIKDLKVMKPNEKFRPSKLAKKALVGFLGWFYKDARDQVESKTEFQGQFKDPQVIPLRAALDLFAIAFLEALS